MAQFRTWEPHWSEPSSVVASYTTYAEAQRAVEVLTARRFPVEHLGIVAGDLTFLEPVTGRRGYVGASLDGMAAGAVTGALLGFILGLFTLVTPLTSGLTLALWGAIIGAFLGALVGMIAHAFSGGRRDFDSVQGLDAGRYDVVVRANLAERARRLLEPSAA